MAIVHVAPGTYTNSLLSVTNAITIAGEGGDRNAVVIDANGGPRAFYLNHADATLFGLTVRNGKTTSTYTRGANVYIDSAGGTVKNCVISNGRSDAHSRQGLNIYMAAGLVVDSTIHGGVRTGDAQPINGLNISMVGGRVMRCVISGARGTSNGGHVAAAVQMTAGTIENCLLTDNLTTSGAIFVNGADALVANCTVVGNGLSCSSANFYATGVRVGNASARVVNTVVFDRADASAKEEWGNANADCFYKCAFSSSAAFTGANSTVTNLTAADFADYYGGDYRPGSATLVDAGSGSDYQTCAVSLTDLDGNSRQTGASIDIGCYEKDLSAAFVSGEADTYAGLVGVTPVFTTSASGGSGNYTFKWDFGDGSAEQTTASATIAHAYAAAGYYQATVSVSDDGGATWGAPYALLSGVVVAPADIYVDEGSANPAFPYDTPATAATTFADAYGCLTNGVVATLGQSVVDGVAIHVRPGTYSGYGYVLGSAVTVRGEGGDRTAVVFDAEEKGLAFRLAHERASLSGVTVKRGKSANSGIFGGNVSMAAGLVTNCVLTAGRSSGHEARGLNVYLSDGLVVDSEISGGSRTGHYMPCAGLNVYMAGGHVARCVIKGARGNDTDNNAAAAQVEGGVLESCLLTDNRTTAGAIYLNGATARVVNCTVVTNYNSHLSKVFVGLGVVCNNANARVVNCAIYENGGSAKADWGNKHAAYFYNCAFTEAAVFTGENSTVKDLTDKAFRHSERGDYTPKSGGALVDAGTSWDDYLSYGAMSATDLAGNARVLRRLLDIGCYENQASAATTIIMR